MAGEVDILLVEDSRVDAELIVEALKDAGIPHRLDLVYNGEEALRNLRTREVRPDIVLLDLNLPKVPGIEVLKAIKQDPNLRVIPVIILTNSTSPDDVTRCYSHFANAYIRKPIGFDGLTATISITGQFWFQTACLPQSYISVPRVSVPPPASPKRKNSGTTPVSGRKNTK